MVFNEFIIRPIFSWKIIVFKLLCLDSETNNIRKAALRGVNNAWLTLTADQARET